MGCNEGGGKGDVRNVDVRNVEDVEDGDIVD